MALVLDENGNLIDTDLLPGRGLQGRNAPRPVAPTVAVPTPVRPPATTRGQGPQPARQPVAPAPGLPTGLQGRNAPATIAPAQPQPAVGLGAVPGAVPVAELPIESLRASRDAARGVREQDRANVAQFVESQPTFVGAPTPATTLSPDILAATNQRIQAALNEARGPQLQPAQRGVFNAQNTDLGGLAQRAAPSAGLTGLGQFGGQSASDYLATTRAQDQAATARRQQQGAEARLGLERSTLQREATQGTGNQRLAARQALNAFEAQQLQATQEAGATERTGLTVAAQQEQARQQAEANVLAAQAQAQGQLGAAQLRGQFGLQEAQTAAQGRIGAAGITATSPQARLAEERARLIQTQQQLAGQASEAGDIGGTFAALGLQQPRAADVATNALGQPVGTYDARGRFVPYTSEELRAAQQAFAPTPQ